MASNSGLTVTNCNVEAVNGEFSASRRVSLDVPIVVLVNGSSTGRLNGSGRTDGRMEPSAVFEGGAVAEMGGEGDEVEGVG